MGKGEGGANFTDESCSDEDTLYRSSGGGNGATPLRKRRLTWGVSRASKWGYSFSIITGFLYPSVVRIHHSPLNKNHINTEDIGKHCFSR